MHPYTVSPVALARAQRQRGQTRSAASFVAARTALVVVDMQNYFVASGASGEVPAARGIVGSINRRASAMRAAAGQVVWLQTTARGARELWTNLHTNILDPARARKRLQALDEASPEFALYPDLDVRHDDLRIRKIHYSALVAGSSVLDAVLRERGIDTLLIAGTATNVCCESTARDAMMLNYRTVMVSDANATWTDAEHAATLDLFMAFFGDVMTVEQVIACLETRSS